MDKLYEQAQEELSGSIRCPVSNVSSRSLPGMELNRAKGSGFYLGADSESAWMDGHYIGLASGDDGNIIVVGEKAIIKARAAAHKESVNGY